MKMSQHMIQVWLNKWGGPEAIDAAGVIEQDREKPEKKKGQEGSELSSKLL
jgi:hypothetical protein